MAKIGIAEDMFITIVSSLIDKTCPSFIGQEKGPWIDEGEVMDMLHVTSKTTVKNFRVNQRIKYTAITPRVIVYCKYSIEEYLKSKTINQL